MDWLHFLSLHLFSTEPWTINKAMKHRLFKNIITLLFLFGMAFNLQAQNQTAYQKRCNEIYVKYYKIFTYGYEKSITLDEQIAIGLIGANVACGAAALDALQRWPMSKVEQISSKMDAELKQAEALMTEEERREKARNAERDRIASTSVGRLKLLVEDSINNWSQKGEFEKTEDWRTRIESKSKDCFSIYCRKLFPDYSFDISTLKYDADNEIYLFKVSYRLRFQNKTVTEEMNVSVPMNVTDAKNLDDNNIVVTDVVWGCTNNSIQPKAFKLKAHNKLFSVTTQVDDLVIDASQLSVKNDYAKSLSYNYTQKGLNRIQNREAIRNCAIGYNRKLKYDADSLNRIINSYLYAYQASRNEVVADTIPIKEYDNVELEIKSEYLKLYGDMVSRKDKALQNMKKDLRRYNSDKYVETFLAEDLTRKEQINAMYLECRCDYKSFRNFVLAYEEGKISKSNCNCRENYWSEYKSLFDNREEFDKTYNLGEDKMRRELKLRQEMEEKLMQYKRILCIEIQNGFMMNAVGKQDMQNAANNRNPYIREVYNYLQNFKGYSVYHKAIDALFEINDKMSKEYEKQSKYFDSKEVFVEEYMSDGYKTKLKERKKAYK